MTENGAPQPKGKSEADHLAALVAQLQAECDRLRSALAKTEAERDLYLETVYAYLRANLDVGEVEFDELQRMSAGPVELVE